MKPTTLLTRSFALSLSLALALPPGPAQALRTQELSEDSRRTSGLEEALRTSPDATLEEIGLMVRPFLPLSAPPPTGLEELAFPPDFRYEPIAVNTVPELQYRLSRGRHSEEYKNRVMRDKMTGHRYLLKFEDIGSPHQQGNPWPTKNQPLRQRLAFRLARAMRANVPDIIIPSSEERQVFAQGLRQLGFALNPSSNDVYLERLTYDYKETDPEIFHTDYRKAFTRNFVVAFWMRIADFRRGNMAPIAGTDDWSMMFDHDGLSMSDITLQICSLQVW